MTIITDRFADLAAIQSRTLGFADLPIGTVPHPVAGLDPAVVRERGRELADAVWAALSTGGAGD